MFESRVIAGKGRGKGLGFPTLNLEIPATFDIQQGIYACRVTIAAATYKGALHFGPIPVFADPTPSLEIFVLDWPAQETPDRVSFEMGPYLRPIRTFETPTALAEQISRDIAAIRAL